MSEYTGVEEIIVSLENESANVTFQPDLIKIEQIIEHIEDMGFEAELFVSLCLFIPAWDRFLGCKLNMLVQAGVYKLFFEVCL